MTGLSVFQRSFDYYSRSNKSKRELSTNLFFIAFQEQGIYFLSGVNTTYTNAPKQDNCYKGVYAFDIRCRFWFIEGQQQSYVQILEPKYVYQFKNPDISTLFVQKLVDIGGQNPKALISVLGYNLKLSIIQDYFKNFANSTKQLYFIEPVSQIIYYNSNQQNQEFSTNDNLSRVELDFLQSKEDAQLFNNTIKQNFNSYIYKSVDSARIEETSQLNFIQKTFTYNRNGTKSYVILNPIFIYDKEVVQKQYMFHQQFKVEIPFLQINIISDQDIISISNELETQFNKYYLVVSIMLGILGFLSIVATLMYALRIQGKINASIQQLTQLLESMADLNDQQELFELNTDQLFLSQETHELYESFKGIYLILVNLSNNYFSDNQTQTLLKLYQNIEFFKTFRNIHALGITHNNIASIMLSQGHYLQALKQFSNSIIYANYEIEEFCNDNPTTQTSIILSEFCFKKESPQILQKLKGASTEDKLKTTNQVKSSNQDLSSLPNQIEDICNENSKLNQSKRGKIIASLFESINKLSKGENKLQYQTTNRNFEENFHEQRVGLLQNLFFRKRNYIIALIAFQETLDRERSQFSCNLYNFWQEINTLLKELLQISKYLPLKNNQSIEIYILISKCQFQLCNIKKSTQIADLCESYLKYLKQQSSNQQENNNLLTIQPSYRSKKQKIISFEIKKKQNSITKWNLNKIQQRNDDNSIIFSQKDRKDVNERKFIGRGSFKKRVPTLLINNQSINEANKDQSQSNQLSQNLTLSFVKQNQESPFQSQIKIFQKQNQNDNQNHSAINLLTNENYIPKQNNNLLSVQNKQFFNQNFNPVHSQQQVKQSEVPFCNLGKDFQTNQNDMQQSKEIISYNSSNKQQQQQQMNKLKEALQKIQSQFKNSKYDTSGDLQQSLINDIININNDGIKNENITQDIETIFENRRKRDQYLENEFQLFNYYSTLNLETIINFTKAEYHMNQQEYYQACYILTSIFENQRYIVSHYPFMMASKIKQIFDLNQIQSSEINQLYLKFNPNISIQIGMIFACGLNVEQIFSSAHLLSDIVGSVLNQQDDQIGIVLIEMQDSYIQQYMAYTKVTLVKQFMHKIINDVLLMTIVKKDKDLYIGLCKQFNETIQQGKQPNLTSEVSKSFSFNQEKNQELSSDQEVIECINITDTIDDSFSKKSIQKADDQSLQNFSKKCVYQQEDDDKIVKSLSNISITDLQQQDNTFSNLSLHLQNQQIILQNNDIHNTTFNSKLEIPVSQNTSIDFGKDKKLFFDLNIENNSQLENVKESEYLNFTSKVEIPIFQSITEIHDSNRSEFMGQLSDSFILDDNFLKQFDRNYLFHICMRKMLNGIQLNRQKQLNSNKNNNQNNLFDYQQKFTIYCTDEIQIDKNYLFKLLCQLLSYYNICLIIYSSKKGKNFLEVLPDQTFHFNNKVIIKVFYGNQQIISFLKNCRDSVSQYIYPTIVQHF